MRPIPHINGKMDTSIKIHPRKKEPSRIIAGGENGKASTAIGRKFREKIKSNKKHLADPPTFTSFWRSPFQSLRLS